MKLTSYLVFNGQAEEAANFYAEVIDRYGVLWAIMYSEE